MQASQGFTEAEARWSGVACVKSFATTVKCLVTVAVATVTGVISAHTARP